jgi:hypothetical protein
MTTQPPDESLHPYLVLAQEIRAASANRDYVTLGTLLVEHLQPDMVDVMVYLHSSVGHLTLQGSYVQIWSPIPPGALGREPTLGEMALILQAAART